MNLIVDQIICKDELYINRNTQSCDYYFDQTYLFSERSHFPHNIFKPCTFRQYFYQIVVNKEDGDKLAQKYNCSLFQLPYSEKEEYHLRFEDNNAAVAFCQTEDFDNLTKNAKIED